MTKEIEDNLNADEITLHIAEAEAQILLCNRGKSVLLKRADSDEKLAFWTGLVVQLKGIKREQDQRRVTEVRLVGGEKVLIDMPIEEAYPLLMPEPAL